MSPNRYHQTEATETVFFLLAAMAYANNKTEMEHVAINVANQMVKHYLPFKVFFKASESMETMIKQCAAEMGRDPLDICADPKVELAEIELEIEHSQPH
ncbi:hypothetical protein [Sansalvadorimonas verongulae]|uniref:hypothetical protein n=1 Tax=Sansalvadorimonas verongulae TaxID=2172824 RepID=UPI0012BB6EA9|nr:hypothetical protein [Sansalvadorimonas verongulae]MTI12178.1 hypothetical protein [Sansalvadorimonas verongulae]